MSDINIEKLFVVVSGIDDRLKKVEKFVSKWTSEDEDVSFVDSECSKPKGELSSRLEIIEKTLCEISDRMIAIDLQMQKFKSVWPTPGEARDDENSRHLEKALCKGQGKKCDSGHAPVEKDKVETQVHIIDEEKEGEVDSLVYVIDDEDLVVEMKDKDSNCSSKSAEEVWSEAIASKKHVKIIGDSMARDICNDLEIQSDKVVSGVCIPGAKIEKVTHVVSQLENDKNRHLMLLTGTNNIHHSDCRDIFRAYKVLVERAKKVENRKITEI